MSRISWGTMRKELNGAEIALGGTNQARAAQKLEGVIGYIQAADKRVTQRPRSFSEQDAEKLRQAMDCFKNRNLRRRDKKTNFSGYLAEGLATVRALKAVVGLY